MAGVAAIGGTADPIEKRKTAMIDEAEEKEQFDSMMQVERAKGDQKAAEHGSDVLKGLFADPEKMLKLWLMNETKPNPFAQEQKDPMETFGKFLQSMLMQTQTDSLNKLKDTMVRNNKYSATGLMGQMVEIESDKMNIAPGRKIVQNFAVPDAASAFEVEIKNASDEVVYRNQAFNVSSGINQFTWDGVDNEGKLLPIGEYKISVSLKKEVKNEDGSPKLEHMEYAVDLDGKQIHDKIETLSMIDREVQFAYEIPEGLAGMKYASVWILNSKNQAVHKTEIEAKGGQKGVYSWNCLDASGHRVPEDIYSVQINFKDEKRKMLETDKQAVIRVTGKVQGVEVNDNGEPNLITSRIKAPLSTVKRIVSENGL
ncbi:FlgD immunoglobulin-like domain containing protein [Candidatus Bodocaedibacter vickermanii]|uniref:Flagellar biosynthesis protein FlgD n=1 Tax=Candidatus Bodocaedibacter vickermanii TaxID=2741701 RepID=A0A7L9RSK6_9PROT|nr:Flagellar biosynthesis protein FlgD [Candidatus Paracaedibacteraceae bacterium 'Lake Konstanz']